MTVTPLHQLLTRLLLEAAPHLAVGHVEELIAIRVSDESLAKLAAHVQEGLRIYERHAVVGPWLQSLPDGLFTGRDEAARRRHGIHRVEVGHIHDGVARTKRVGYAAIAHGGTRASLLLFVHHNASENDVVTPRGPENSWAELLVGAWEWAEQCRILRFSRDDRMNRSNAVWVRINDTVKARPGGRYYLADIEVDPHRDGWFAMVTGQKSSEEVEVGKGRRLAGRLTKLTSGGWPRGYVPLGLRLGRLEDVRGELQADRRAGVVADLDRAAEITTVLQRYAAGVSKARIAIEQACRGARDGQGALLLPRAVPLLRPAAREEVRSHLPLWVAAGTISPRERERSEHALSLTTNAERREKATSTCVEYVDRVLAARRHLRTGVLHVWTFGAIAGKTDYLGWRPTFITATPGNKSWVSTITEDDLAPDHPYWQLDAAKKRKAQTHGFWLTSIEFGAVVELPDADWHAIEERIRQAQADMERRTASGQRRPLAGLKWTTEGGRYQIGQGGEHETYRILGPDGTHLHTVNATHAARALGDLLLGLVERVDAGPLPLLERAADSPVTRECAIRRRIAELEAELGAVEEQISGLLRDRAAAPSGSREHRLTSEQIDQLGERAEDIEHTKLAALHRKLARSEREEDTPALEETAADFGHLTVVALALLRCEPQGPAAVHDAVSWLLNHGRGLANLRAGEHDRQILIDVQVRVPLADGTVRWLDGGTLDLTDRRLSATRKRETADDLVRRLLRDDEPLEALTARFGRPTADLLVEASAWLARHSPLNSYLRAATVTASAAHGRLPVGPVIYAHATQDAKAQQHLRAQHGEWIIKQIQRAYLSSDATWAKNSGWVRTSLRAARTAMASVAQDGPVRRQTLIAAVDGLTNDEHLKDLLHPGRRTFWQPPLQLHDGWVSPHPCRYRYCPGGNAAPMTGFLPVPELLATGDAVYCRYCWKTLTTGTVLPAAYRELWEVPTHTSALHRADGLPFAAEPTAAPTRGVNVLRTRDVAEALGLPMHRVQRLAEDGHIPATRNPRGKFVFDADRALAPSIRARFSAPARSADTSQPAKLNLQRAANHLGTTPKIVRLLARYHGLTNIGSGYTALYQRSDVDGVLADIRRQTGRPSATMADLATQTELADKWHITPAKIRRLIAHGVLDGITLGTVTFGDRRSIDQLDDRQRRALDPTQRMTTAQVAAQAGIHNTTVLHHYHNRALAGVQLTPDSTVWFLPDEVNAWLGSARPSA